ncbi:MAG TPA: hypothetical protein VFE47_01635 [Tepidisphaeraceae bacterium]|nr:hypothetical protein [Tepidisphaeraceae bacterium]
MFAFLFFILSILCIHVNSFLAPLFAAGNLVLERVAIECTPRSFQKLAEFREKKTIAAFRECVHSIANRSKNMKSGNIFEDPPLRAIDPGPHGYHRESCFLGKNLAPRAATRQECQEKTVVVSWRTALG